MNEDKNSDILIYHNMGKIKSKGLHHFEVLYPKDKTIIISLEKYNQLFKKNTKKKLTKRRSKKLTKRRLCCKISGCKSRTPNSISVL